MRTRKGKEKTRKWWFFFTPFKLKVKKKNLPLMFEFFCCLIRIQSEVKITVSSFMLQEHAHCPAYFYFKLCKIWSRKEERKKWRYKMYFVSWLLLLLQDLHQEMFCLLLRSQMCHWRETAGNGVMRFSSLCCAWCFFSVG